jgi:hypothetical protein
VAAAAALRVPLAPSCPDCRGGGDVNGVPCRGCEGRGRLRPAKRLDWRGMGRRLLSAAAAPAGTVVRWSMSLPGLSGAAAVSYGSAAVLHGLVPRIPELGLALLVAGVFGLLADRRL